MNIPSVNWFLVKFDRDLPEIKNPKPVWGMLSLPIPRQIGPSHSLDRVDSLDGVAEISHELLSTLMDEIK